MTKAAVKRRRRNLRRDAGKELQPRGMSAAADDSRLDHSTAHPFSSAITGQNLLRSIAVHRWILITLTCACLLPFINEAFHIDDSLFLWVAKQIVKDPFNPYGFPVVWYGTAMPMSEVTKNPPLA